MFCPNCGTNLPDNAEFCSNCGTNLNNYKTIPNLNENKKINNHKIKDFIIKYKKIICICIIVFIILFIGVFSFNKLYDYTKIDWDKNYGDINVTHTRSTTLKLNILAYDKDSKPIQDIKFSSKDGQISSDGSKVEWTLPTKAGNYTIVASAPSGKKVKKNVKVVEVNDIDEEQELYGIISDPVDDNVTDSDNDGLMNAREIELGTNIYSADTDADGLLDKLEVEVTKTDPLKKDTDGDGINDGDELDLGLDPLKIDSKGDGIKDSDRSLTYNIDENNLGISMQINGKGNIASSTIDIIKNSTFTNMDGLLDTIYNFYTTGTIESAIVTIKYNVEEINKKGLDENNLTLYYFDEESKKLEALPTTIDIENKTITVTLKHFSKYVIGDNNIVLTDTNSQIMFVIDNSVSMYTYDQLTDLGYYDITGADGNDSTFKRLSLTNKLIDMFTGNYYFGVSEFAGNYVNMQKFTDDKDKVKKSVDAIKNDLDSVGNGTKIVSALTKGLTEFDEDDYNHYIILLTDGKDTSSSMGYSKSKIISEAKDNNVKICVIGLGNNLDTDDLKEIAEETGCGYYNASNSSALDEIYSVVGADINYNLVDTDGDNKVDGMIQADSGFIVTRDGFSFENFTSNKSPKGHCYGMATFAMLYYKKELPLSMQNRDIKRLFTTYSSNGYDLSDTFIEDKQNLYDYKITDEALKLLLEENPDDYRDRVENKTWMIKKEYYEKLQNIGATISTKKYTGKDKDFDKYQSALLTIDSDPFNKIVVKDESQLLNAVWRLFILQFADKDVSFSTDPDKAYVVLNDEFNNGTPVVLGVAGNHAVNGIRLIQDINDANKFKIEIYDNNYPGETRYINVTRNKFSKFTIDYTAWVNEYNYTFTYGEDKNGNPKEVSLEIEQPIIE